LPGRRNELPELLKAALAEDRRGVANKVLPELAGLLWLLWPRCEPHEPLLEPLGLERARARILHDEDAAMTAAAQHVTDANAVVRRPERPFGEEDDRSGSGVQRPNLAPGRR